MNKHICQRGLRVSPASTQGWRARVARWRQRAARAAPPLRAARSRSRNSARCPAAVRLRLICHLNWTLPLLRIAEMILFAKLISSS